jgi:hypothetical protein
MLIGSGLNICLLAESDKTLLGGIIRLVARLLHFANHRLEYLMTWVMATVCWGTLGYLSTS